MRGWMSNLDQTPRSQSRRCGTDVPKDRGGNMNFPPMGDDAYLAEHPTVGPVVCINGEPAWCPFCGFEYDDCTQPHGHNCRTQAPGTRDGFSEFDRRLLADLKVGI